MSEAALLSLRDIHHSFYQVPVLKGVDFDLRAGEVHALVGENGAGKSTLLSILSGLRVPQRGKVYVKGEECHLHSSKAAADKGISLIHQELQLIPYLNAVQNIFLGDGLSRLGFKKTRQMREQAQEWLGKLGVNVPLDQPVENLSIAQKQMIEIARALRKGGAVLAMDEPSSSLGPSDVDHLFAIIQRLRAQGCGIIYVSHRVEEVLSISDRVTVLRDGQLIDTQPAISLSRGDLIEMMVGRRIVVERKKEYRQGSKVLLEVNALAGPGVKHASFKLHQGEILGCFGLVGAGRSELAYLLAGAEKWNHGSVAMKGVQIRWRSVEQAMRRGVVLLPEDRKGQGLVAHLDAVTNVSLPVMQRYCLGKCFLRKKFRAGETSGILRKIRLQPANPRLEARYFSGGNQQKIVVARWLNAHSEVLIFDEPTRGIDVQAKQEIYTIMQKLADEGKGVLMISSEIEEVMLLSDRALVMAAGRVRAILEKEDITENNIMHYAVMHGHDTAASEEALPQGEDV